MDFYLATNSFSLWADGMTNSVNGIVNKPPAHFSVQKKLVWGAFAFPRLNITPKTCLGKVLSAETVLRIRYEPAGWCLKRRGAVSLRGHVCGASFYVNAAQWRAQTHFIFMVFLAWCKGHQCTWAAVHTGTCSAGKQMNRKNAGCENRRAQTNLAPGLPACSSCAAVLDLQPALFKVQLERVNKNSKGSESEVTAGIMSTELSIFSTELSIYLPQDTSTICTLLSCSEYFISQIHSFNLCKWAHIGCLSAAQRSIPSLLLTFN